MAGVKGKSGGKREGAGRKPNPPVLLPSAGITSTGDAITRDPVAFLTSLMVDVGADIKVRADAAKALLPYTHTKKGEAGKKDEQKEAAAVAARGRFAPMAPPRLVANNR